MPDFVTINLDDLQEKFAEGDEVSLETLQQKRVFNLSGRDAKLPLKVGRPLPRVFSAAPQLLCTAVPFGCHGACRG